MNSQQLGLAYQFGNKNEMVRRNFVRVVSIRADTVGEKITLIIRVIFGVVKM